MKFCVNIYLDSLWSPVDFQGHLLKVKVTCFSVFFFVCDTAATRGQYLALSSLRLHDFVKIIVVTFSIKVTTLERLGSRYDDKRLN